MAKTKGKGSKPAHAEKKHAPMKKKQTYTIDLSRYKGMHGISCVCMGPRKPDAKTIRKAVQKFRKGLTRPAIGMGE